MPAAMQSALKPAAPSTTQRASLTSKPQPTVSRQPPAQAPSPRPLRRRSSYNPPPPLRARAASLSHAPESPIARASARQSVLMITSIPGADSCAASLAAALGVPVEIASSRKLGLSALRRRDYATVIVDDSIAEADPAGTDLIWKHSGLAVPLQINFALVGCARLGREVRAALGPPRTGSVPRHARGDLEPRKRPEIDRRRAAAQLRTRAPGALGAAAARKQAAADGRARRHAPSSSRTASCLEVRVGCGAASVDLQPASIRSAGGGTFRCPH